MGEVDFLQKDLKKIETNVKFNLLDFKKTANFFFFFFFFRYFFQIQFASRARPSRARDFVYNSSSVNGAVNFAEKDKTSGEGGEKKAE